LSGYCSIAEDPAEEAALDWQWLEREVESELNTADRAKRSRAPVQASSKLSEEDLQAELDEVEERVAADGRTEAEIQQARAAAYARDQEELRGVLDEVDLGLWQRLIGGIESTQEELLALREAGIAAGGRGIGRMLAEAERETGIPSHPQRGASVPVRTVHDSDALAAAQRHPYTGGVAGASGPVYSIPLHSQRFERPQASHSTDRMYSDMQHPVPALRAGAVAPLFRRRPSPFASDDSHQSVQEAISAAASRGSTPSLSASASASSVRLDAAAAAGSQEQVYMHAVTGGAPAVTLSRSASRARILNASPERAESDPNSRIAHAAPSASPLPAAAVRPYEAWIRKEMSVAMSGVAAAHPLAQSVPRPVVASNVNLLSANRTSLSASAGTRQPQSSPERIARMEADRAAYSYAKAQGLGTTARK
jgi:hypothetical protein